MITSKLLLFFHHKLLNLFPCLSEWIPLKFNDKITKETLSLLTKLQLILYSLGQTKHSEEEKEENFEGNQHLK